VGKLVEGHLVVGGHQDDHACCLRVDHVQMNMLMLMTMSRGSGIERSCPLGEPDVSSDARMHICQAHNCGVGPEPLTFAIAGTERALGWGLARKRRRS
jgi:hypothetical protein